MPYLAAFQHTHQTLGTLTMARNIARTLTAEELTRVKTARNAMPVGATVEFTYTKDNGERSQRAGAVVEFRGVDSTLSVVIDTDNGIRTFNLRNVTGTRVAL